MAESSRGLLKEAEKGFSQEDARWVKRHGPADASAGSDSLCYWHGVTVVLNRRDGRGVCRDRVAVVFGHDDGLLVRYQGAAFGGCGIR